MTSQQVLQQQVSRFINTDTRNTRSEPSLLGKRCQAFLTLVGDASAIFPVLRYSLETGSPLALAFHASPCAGARLNRQHTAKPGTRKQGSPSSSQICRLHLVRGATLVWSGTLQNSQVLLDLIAGRVAQA